MISGIPLKKLNCYGNSRSAGMRIFPKKIFLGVGLGVLGLLTAGLILGFYSLSTMREVVSGQFNQQQLVLAEQAARRIEADFRIILQELAILNQSPTVQYPGRARLGQPGEGNSGCDSSLRRHGNRSSDPGRRHGLFGQPR